jgi:Predicted AAA-ATPase
MSSISFLSILGDHLLLLFLLEIVVDNLSSPGTSAYCLCLCMSETVDESIDEVSSSSDSEVLEPKTKMAKTEGAEINLAKVKGTIGSSNLKKFLSNRGLFIDKTLFIKEFMGCDFEVLALLFPRRFGKSLNMDILHSFLSLSEESSIDFSGLKIGEYVAFVNKHRGTYPVIRLDLKECQGKTWNKMLKSIWKSLKLMLRDHKDLKETIINTESFSVEDDVDYQFALKFLSAALYDKHGKEVIILIDEFDTPLNEAYRHGYYEEASKFFSTFYSAGLKGNKFLAKACLVRICQPDVLPNNVKVFNSADDEFSEHFGFSLEEISHLIPVGASADEIKEWYNGYFFGKNRQILNPFSFMSYAVSVNSNNRNGSFDISIEFLFKNKSVFFGFTRSSTKEALTDDATKAYRGIIDKRYSMERDGEVLLIGVSFYEKEMSALLSSNVRPARSSTETS